MVFSTAGIIRGFLGALGRVVGEFENNHNNLLIPITDDREAHGDFHSMK
jgi:hypothetical protein